MSQKYTKDSLGTRMKTYEKVTQSSLIIRTPVLIRLDGKAFHTFAPKVSREDPGRGDTPFSPIMHFAMAHTAAYLVNNVQGCVLAYTQSDEISLLLRDWDDLTTQQWFGNNIQKMVSVSASMATAAFNNYLQRYTDIEIKDLAMFDSRVFNLPEREVANYFIWRQQDAIRNSVQMFGHHHFSQKQMHGKNNIEVQDMLKTECGVSWEDIPHWARYGTCIENAKHGEGVVVNEAIPTFASDRTYINRFLNTPAQVIADRERQEEVTDLILSL